MAKRKFTWNVDYGKDYPDMEVGKKGNTYTICKKCKCDFTIASGGVYSMKEHVKTQKHKENVKRGEENEKAAKLTTFHPSSSNLEMTQK